MNYKLIEQMADAVLYEGYTLYPYRPSAVKSQQRFNFGVLTPQAYSNTQRGTECWAMQTECLLLAGETSEIDVKVRFLQLVSRDRSDDRHPYWREAGEQEVKVSAIRVGDLIAQPRQLKFSFPARTDFESLLDPAGKVASVIRRFQLPISGTIEIRIADCRLPIEKKQEGRRLFKLTICISNQTPIEQADQKVRDDALLQSLISTHAIIGARSADFISLLNPPASYREAAARCHNIGTWPVLVGERGAHDVMLSSPIVLDDYPHLVSESAGDLGDGAEINEMLMLRILTLSDEEKDEMRRADERTRAMLETVEAFSAARLMKLHGVFRSASE